MDRIKVIEAKKSILADNDADANRLRDELHRDKTFYLNVMSSPGSGKTTTILATIRALNNRLRVGVVEADIDSSVDARHIEEGGTRAVQLHTGGMCHLDAQMSRQGMAALGTDDLDLVILENVGNLVCPAEFDTGACLDVVILSVPEGDDKPFKYPLMFQRCGVVLVNKIDAAPAFDFDLGRAREAILARNPEAQIFPISAATGEGIDEWADWLCGQVETWLAQGKEEA